MFSVKGNIEGSPYISWIRAGCLYQSQLLRLKTNPISQPNPQLKFLNHHKQQSNPKKPNIVNHPSPSRNSSREVSVDAVNRSFTPVESAIHVSLTCKCLSRPKKQLCLLKAERTSSIRSPQPLVENLITYFHKTTLHLSFTATLTLLSQYFQSLVRAHIHTLFTSTFTHLSHTHTKAYCHM